jgi:hypothetical protein
MSRRRLLIVGLLAVLWAAAAPAGEIKTHYWPCDFVPQEIATIPVLMDIGYWIEIVNQDAFIKLKQVTINTYEGCTNLQVRCNADLTMGCSISPTERCQARIPARSPGAPTSIAPAEPSRSAPSSRTRTWPAVPGAA